MKIYCITADEDGRRILQVEIAITELAHEILQARHRNVADIEKLIERHLDKAANRVPVTPPLRIFCVPTR